ncbi:translation initiation factor IF-2 [Terasakiispira papahanaumokuakeensis]|uniref:Translation initiation factor IF-2 n=1 Tax=Terasakiispira papahanaumokuakeensis TaxID=197479 RepID=A0A1E2VD40_9GAMM|nr:translation initiation factor IF-2 [Terasakiispira papahanaumokuakeensis]ODC04863.1 translation initiation factor IF-2 [Terasakiispira papahanaumokuakeensis]
MAETTVKDFAEAIGRDVDRLLEQMKEAGLPHTAAKQSVSEQDKETLLAYLKRSSGTKSSPTKITMNRRERHQLKTDGKKSVKVEVRKKRTFVKKRDLSTNEPEANETAASAAPESAAAAPVEAAPAETTQAQTAAPEQATAPVAEKAVADQAPVEDQAALAKEDAERKAQEEAALRKAEAELEAKRKETEVTRREAEEAARRQLEAEEAERKAAKQKASSETAEQTAQREKDEAAKERRRQEEKRRADKARRERANPIVITTVDEVAQADPEEEAAESARVKVDKDEKPRGKGTGRKSAGGRRGGKRNDDYEERGRRGDRRKGRGKGAQSGAPRQHGFEKPTAPIKREVSIPESITVADLADKMAVKGPEVIKMMFKMGAMATINQVIDQDTAAILVEEMGHTPKLLKENALETEVMESVQYDGQEVDRAPVVTVMGHVDHGKTSLLDYIRRAKVATGEAGGITQHIGAYHVQTDSGMVTFLDTPGHAAFTAMRARGAQATDVVILVVAADDGVMPQTIEAVQHAKAAGVPIVVAVNKIDKPEADPDRVKNELAQYEVIPEDWGGDTQFVHVSAKSGEGIDALLEAVLLQSEILELKAMEDVPAKGVVVESRLDRGRGSVATILVQSGTLRKGDIVLAGLHYGRVRALIDENGQPVESAGPSIPAEILGLDGTPEAGDEFLVVADEKKAREVALFRQGKFREVKLARQQKAKLENVFNNMGQDEAATVNLVLKADVRGSLEAIIGALKDLETDEVKVAVVSSGVGGITETDANLALASEAIVIGFNVRADAAARQVIEREELELRYYSVIYELIDQVKQAMSGKLAPDFKEEIVGVAEVRDVFRSPKFGAVAGCMVVEGNVHRHKKIRVLRDNVVIYEGELESLRRFKDDVNEVRNGMECGIGVKNYNDVKVGDKIEVFDKVKVERSL